MRKLLSTLVVSLALVVVVCQDSSSIFQQKVQNNSEINFADDLASLEERTGSVNVDGNGQPSWPRK